MNIKIPEKTGGVEITLSYVLLALTAAIVEEFFYRGTIMNLCMTRFKAPVFLYCTGGDGSTVDSSYSFSEGEITITVMSVIIGIMIITITAIWMKKYNRNLLNQKGEEE